MASGPLKKLPLEQHASVEEPFRIIPILWFLGCSRYPKCKNLTKLDADGNVVEAKSTPRSSNSVAKPKGSTAKKKPSTKAKGSASTKSRTKGTTRKGPKK